MAITLSTDKNHGRSARAVSSHTWDEFARVYPIYVALTRQCGLPDGPYPAGAIPGSWPDKKTRERDILWLDEVDRRIEAVHLRQFLAFPILLDGEEHLPLLMTRILFCALPPRLSNFQHISWHEPLSKLH